MSFMKWAFLNENTCTRQMDPASHLDVPLVVSARKIKPHWTRQDPLIPAQSIDFTLGNVIPPIKHIWSLGFHILKEGAVNEFRKGGSLRTLKCSSHGSGLMPLRSITSGTDYSEMLFGWWRTRHSGDPASMEDNNLTAARCCILCIFHQRQRKGRKRTMMLTDLKQHHSETWTDLLKSLSLKELTLSITSVICVFMGNCKIPPCFLFMKFNYLT